MSKTIRRKNCKNTSGYYDWKDQDRNRQGASDAYFHADMPNRNGRGASVHKGVKGDANTIRRCEARILKGRIAKQGALEVESFNDDKLAKAKSNECWQWS